MDLGSKIKELRKSKNMKQSELADKANISRVAVGNYERNERTPGIEIIKNIANALNVPTGYLMGLEEYQIQIDKHVDKVFEYQDKMNDPFLSDEERTTYEKLRNEEIHAKRLLEDEATDQIRYNKIIEEIEISLKKLTYIGQKEAAKRVEELTHIKEYII